MNAQLRSRAERLLLFQEYGMWTDSRTLNAAIAIAHHNRGFATIREWAPFFETLAKMFREKFPECPCRACRRSPNLAPSTGSGHTPTP